MGTGDAEWSDGKLLDEMLASADQAMYSTKALHKLARGNPSAVTSPELSTRTRTLADS